MEIKVNANRRLTSESADTRNIGGVKFTKVTDKIAAQLGLDLEEFSDEEGIDVALRDAGYKLEIDTPYGIFPYDLDKQLLISSGYVSSVKLLKALPKDKKLYLYSMYQGGNGPEMSMISQTKLKAVGEVRDRRDLTLVKLDKKKGFAMLLDS